MTRAISHLAIQAMTMLVATSALADPVSGEPGTYGHMFWNGGHGWFAGIGMLLFWVVVIGLIVVVVRTTVGGQSIGSASNAVDILRARYAKGEIDDDEFQRRKKQLEA